MRIWDVEVRHLCRQHLLGEHRELHGMWNILTTHGGRGGYSRHPETLRWQGKLRALHARHDALVAEMDQRGFRHLSPLPDPPPSDDSVQDVLIDSLRAQRAILRAKKCGCGSRPPRQRA